MRSGQAIASILGCVEVTFCDNITRWVIWRNAGWVIGMACDVYADCTYYWCQIGFILNFGLTYLSTRSKVGGIECICIMNNPKREIITLGWKTRKWFVERLILKCCGGCWSGSGVKKIYDIATIFNTSNRFPEAVDESPSTACPWPWRSIVPRIVVQNPECSSILTNSYVTIWRIMFR